MSFGKFDARCGWLFVALFALVVPAVPVDAENFDKARDLVGLMLDNQNRCRELAHGKLAILEEDLPADQRSEEIERHLNGESTSLRVAKRAIDIVWPMTKRLKDSKEDSVSRAVESMFHAQKSLCDWSTSASAWGSVNSHRETVLEQEASFERAHSSLPVGLQLDNSARRAVIDRYRKQLYGFGHNVTDEAIEQAMAEDRGLFSDQPIDSKQYQRKKKEYEEWTAEQNRREAEKVRIQAQRRASQLERQKNRPKEMPKVELKSREESGGPAADPEAMAQWHGEYSAKILPFKQTLSAYLKVQAPSRTMMMNKACQDLSRVAWGVLEDPVALESPDEIVGLLLRKALTQFKQASDSCLGNRLQKARDLIEEGSKSLGRAKMALEPYRLGL